MRPTTLRSSAATLLGLLALTSPSLADRTVRTLEAEADVTSRQTVRIDFPIGELRVEGTSGDKVVVELEVRCQRKGFRARCEEAAEKVRVELDSDRDALRAAFRGYPRLLSDDSEISLHGTIRVPADRPLIVEMNIGELEVEGLKRDVDVDLHIGEIRLDLPARSFESASLDAGIGESSLRTPDGWIEGDRSFLIGSEVGWDDGPGESHLRADVGIGEIEVRFVE